MKDKELKLKEIEVSLTLGGTGQGCGTDDTCHCTMNSWYGRYVS